MWFFKSKRDREASYMEALASGRKLLEQYASPQARMSVPLEYRSTVWDRLDSLRMAIEADAEPDSDRSNSDALREVREDIVVITMLGRGRPLDARRWQARADAFNDIFDRIHRLLIEEDSGPHVLGSPVRDHGPGLADAAVEALTWFRARDLHPGLRLSVSAADALHLRLREAIDSIPKRPERARPNEVPQACWCGHDHVGQLPDESWVKYVDCPVPGCTCRLMRKITPGESAT
jgi:hypothetical protein